MEKTNPLPTQSQQVPQVGVSTPLTKSRSLKIILIATISATLIITLIIISYVFWVKKTSPTPASTPSPANSSQKLQNPPLPSKISTQRGILTNVSSDSATLSTSEGAKTFSLTNLKYVQQITSGTFGDSDAITASVSSAALKSEQEVYIVADENGKYAKNIIIIK